MKAIRSELEERFANVDPKSIDDQFSKKMWRFLGEATDRLADLVDSTTLAETTFTEVLRHFGEDEKMQSSEFFGIFKTFVTSYKVKRLPRNTLHKLTVHSRNAKPTTKQ